MANHNLPTLTSTYSNFVSELDGRLDDLAVGMDPAVTTVTNPPANSIRWNSADKKWEKWSGTAWNELSANYAINLQGPSTVSANSTGDALKITQTGSGNAFVVEDSSSPDSTPFVINSAGIVVKGHTQALNIGTSSQPMQIHGAVGNGLSLGRFEDTSFGSDIRFYKSRSATIGGLTIVQNNDAVGNINFFGDDGADANRDCVCAGIGVSVDGNPVTGSVPGRFVFSTTSAGSSSLTERMRIDSDGRIGIGGAPFTNENLRVSRPTSGNIARGVIVRPQIQSDATLSYYGVTSFPSVADASFTLPDLTHFRADQSTFGAGSTVTNQFGFVAAGNLIGATNNYGFYSNIASGTGRWNFYAAGTAPNYFSGDVRTNTVVTQATSPTNSNTSATATASSLLGGIRTGTPTANISLTLPTGTNMDSAFTSLENNMAFEWSVINLASATHTITVAANTNHTVVGNMVVAANSSGRFLTRKTTTNTFVTYRIA